MSRLIFLVLAVFLASQVSRAALEPTILYEEDPTLLITTVEVVVMTGSADDPVEKVGLTNMLASLMLRGTKTKSRTKFQSELERLGASLGVDTEQDTTTFYGSVISENTDEFLKLLEDMLLHPALSPKEFDGLRRELLADTNNIKNENYRLGGLAMRKVAFAGSPLSHTVSGSLSTIQAIKREDLVETYNDRFDRANFVFAVASPLPEKELKDKLVSLWLKFPDGVRHVYHSITPQIPKQPMIIVIQKPKTSTGAILFSQAGITADDADRYGLITGNFAFGGKQLVSRLFQVVRKQLGWTYAIQSTYGALGDLTYQQGIYVILATPSVEYTGKTIRKVLAMWRDYLATGLTPDELQLAKESVINSYPFEFDSAQKRLAMRLHSYLYQVPLLDADQHEKKIDAITNKKILAELSERQSPDQWIITVVADKDVIAKELEDDQKGIPADKQLKISQVLTPEQVIE